MAHGKQMDRVEILAAALALLEKKGRDGLSLRMLAAELGVKAPSLYHYFRDKAALEQALVEEGNRLLLETMRVSIGRKKKKVAFVALAISYLGFARTRPVLYGFMMRESMPAENSKSGQELWKLLLRTVSGISGVPDDASTAVAVWSFLHGFAELERTGRFGMSGPKRGLEFGLEAFLSWCAR